MEIVRDTSAKPTGDKLSAPWKITSSILAPRILRTDCSPKTHLMASAILDFPQPLGPTIAVTPASKSNSVFSANDLNPKISNFLKNIRLILS